MNKNSPLLFDPPYILPPDVVLTQKCDTCGKELGSPYYVIIGIPPSTLMVDTFPCKNIDGEKEAEKMIIWLIQAITKNYTIDSKNQWIFSKQNIRSSKIRVCTECEKYTRPHRSSPPASPVRIKKICFAIEEYQRRHVPIEHNTSDCEKYIISLPDRATVRWKHFDEVYPEEDDDSGSYFGNDMQEGLRIALIPDYKTDLYDTSTLSQEFKTNFIQDKNRLFPNDQELTRWMEKQINDRNYDTKIQFCKIFVNPKTKKYPIYRNNEKEVYNTKYTVVVHYSVPEGGWDEFDV